MTDKPKITNIEYWLEKQKKAKKGLSLGERLALVEKEFERGHIDQDQYDYSINFLMEMEELKATSAPKLSKDEFLALTTQEQIDHTLDLSKEADKAYQKFLELKNRRNNKS